MTSERFDQILDECIDRIVLGGDTVETCLARYPEHAAELEPHLRLIVATAGSLALPSVTDAKERGRQRLRNEMEALRRQDRVRLRPRTPRWFPWGLISAAPRQAIVATSLVLAVLAGSVGTVAASSGSLPGETLYPVKRATEEARLALQFSQQGKATLYLSYAENRAVELSALAGQGDTTRLPATLNEMQGNLKSYENIAAGVRNEQTLASMRTQLEASASQTLTTLQSSFQDAPQEAHDSTSDVFIAASQGYGTAVEQVASKAPPQYAAASPGRMQLWAVDPPPPGTQVQEVVVEVAEIEAHLINDSSSGWVTITSEPQSFDLLHLSDVKRFLGEQEVKPGTYTRVRLHITKASIVIGGVAYQAKVPSNRIELTRPMTVKESGNTVVLLDFDALQSIRVTGTGDYLFAPVIRVLSEEPVKPEAKAATEEKGKSQVDKGKSQQDKEKSESQSDGAKSAPVTPVTPSSPPTATGRRVTIELEGTAESVSADSITVRGKSIAISANTNVEGTLSPGRQVKVEATQQPDGTFLATEIKTTRENDEEEKETGRRPTDAAIETTGVIEAMDTSAWTVAGRKVEVTRETKLTGQPAVGTEARISGTVQSDGTIIAKTIVVLPQSQQDTPLENQGKGKTGSGDQGGTGKEPREQSNDQHQIQVTGDVTSVSPGRIEVVNTSVVVTTATVVEGTVLVGSLIVVEGTSQPDGSVVAAKIKVLSVLQKGGSGDNGDKRDNNPPPKSTPTAEKRPPQDKQETTVEIQGRLDQLAAGYWVVNGQKVFLTSKTAVAGVPAIGAKVEVEGIRQSDGAIQATKIQVSHYRDDSRPEPTPLATNTPTARPGATATPTSVITPSPTPTAAHTVLPTPTPTPTTTPTPATHQVLEGLLQKMEAGKLQVAGRSIVITKETDVEGVITLGAKLRIEGTLLGDGSIAALKVKVLSSGLPGTD